MTQQSLKNALRDVSFTIATPFTDDGDRVHHDRLAENVATLEERGASVLLPCGNTGEYYALTDGERVDVVRTTVEAASPRATVVGGVGGSTKHAAKLISEYESVGADGVMIMHPTYTYIHPRGLVEYFERLISGTELGVVLYKRGPEVTRDMLTGLSTADNVVGVKYAVNDVDSFSATADSLDGEVTLLNGIAERFAPSFAVEGADGFTTGIGNFLPEHVCELQEAIEARDWERAKEIRNVLRPFEELRDEPAATPFASAKNVPTVKFGMDLQGMYGGPVREPLRSLSEEDERRVQTYLGHVEESELVA